MDLEQKITFKEKLNKGLLTFCAGALALGIWGAVGFAMDRYNNRMYNHPLFNQVGYIDTYISPVYGKETYRIEKQPTNIPFMRSAREVLIYKDGLVTLIDYNNDGRVDKIIDKEKETHILGDKPIDKKHRYELSNTLLSEGVLMQKLRDRLRIGLTDLEYNLIMLRFEFRKSSKLIVEEVTKKIREIN